MTLLTIIGVIGFFIGLGGVIIHTLLKKKGSSITYFIIGVCGVLIFFGANLMKHKNTTDKNNHKTVAQNDEQKNKPANTPSAHPNSAKPSTNVDQPAAGTVPTPTAEASAQPSTSPTLAPTATNNPTNTGNPTAANANKPVPQNDGTKPETQQPANSANVPNTNPNFDQNRKIAVDKPNTNTTQQPAANTTTPTTNAAANEKKLPIVKEKIVIKDVFAVQKSQPNIQGKILKKYPETKVAIDLNALLISTKSEKCRCDVKLVLKGPGTCKAEDQVKITPGQEKQTQLKVECSGEPGAYNWTLKRRFNGDELCFCSWSNMSVQASEKR